MRDAVRELLITEAAVEKLGRRNISVPEARQLPNNRYVVLRNPHRQWVERRADHRRLMVGATNGGRHLTLVVEPTVDPTDWLVVTGWESANHERRMLRR
jgi:hypothetical protein